MSKYETGAYLILGFDRCGSKVFTRKAECQNLIGATHEGMNAVTAGDCFSFALVRVLHNSITPDTDRWGTLEAQSACRGDKL